MSSPRRWESGVLFACTGRKYILAGIRAAKSVRKHNPGLPIALFADWQAQGFSMEELGKTFDLVEGIDNPHRRSKVDLLERTPFERTLYLDTDTEVLEKIEDLFGVLDRFDMAVAHAMKRNFARRMVTWRVKLPMAFPQFNSGVMLYKANPEVLAFLRQWSEAFHSAGFDNDQTSLRELLWLSDLRFTVLPPEYNVRYMKYVRFWGKEEATPKILHMQKFHDHPAGLALKHFGRSVLGWIRKLGFDPKPKRKK